MSATGTADLAMVEKFFTIRKTVIEMLLDRGYLVSENEVKLDFAEFQSKIEQAGYKVNMMSSIHQKKTDSTDKIAVFYSDDTGAGAKGLSVSYFEERRKLMEKDSVTRAIVVYGEKISSFAKQDLAANNKFVFELFKHAELLVNITKHKLVPKHTLLTDEEKKELLDKYKLNESQLPRILRHDPVARYYGLSRLQVVKITRDSETAGRYITYRIVW